MRWEYWEDEDRTTGCLTVPANIDHMVSTGSWDDNLVFMYAFEAATYEEASAIHALRQGHEPYVPAGLSPAPLP